MLNKCKMASTLIELMIVVAIIGTWPALASVVSYYTIRAKSHGRPESCGPSKRRLPIIPVRRTLWLRLQHCHATPVSTPSKYVSTIRGRVVAGATHESITITLTTRLRSRSCCETLLFAFRPTCWGRVGSPQAVSNITGLTSLGIQRRRRSRWAATGLTVPTNYVPSTAIGTTGVGVDRLATAPKAPSRWRASYLADTRRDPSGPPIFRSNH